MRQVSIDVNSIHEMEWVRLAAFIDGEGSIHIARKCSSGKDARHLGLTLAVSNTDIRLMRWLKHHFKGSVASMGVPKSGQKPAFLWTTRAKHAEILIHKIRPYLLLKKEQAEIAIAFRATFDFGRNQYTPLSDSDHAVREEFRVRISELNRRGVKVQ